jgi:hypothetical protein
MFKKLRVRIRIRLGVSVRTFRRLNVREAEWTKIYIVGRPKSLNEVLLT